MRYDIAFKTPTGETKTTTYQDCENAGIAFTQCQQENPGCTMLHATACSSVKGFEGRTDYEPPPIQRDPVKTPRPYRRPKRNALDGVMPFYDEALSEKPWD